MNKDYEILRQSWQVAIRSSSLRKVPKSVVVCGTPLVLYRIHGQVCAAIDRCPHRNAPLSRGYLQDGRIHCPYHGWGFDHQGRCVSAPGLNADCVPAVSLIRWRAVEQDGWIWVAPPDVPDSKPIYRSHYASIQGYEGHVFEATIDAQLADALENLLDGTHTPFVHSGLVRSRERTQRFTARVRREAEFVEAEYRGESGQQGIISRWFEPERTVSYGRYVPPASAELEYRSQRRTELFVIAHFTPTTIDSVKAFVTAYVPKGKLPAFVRRIAVRCFFGRVLAQDRRILEQQHDNLKRFDTPSYTYWKADLLRPWIDAWLEQGTFPLQPNGPEVTEFNL